MKIVKINYAVDSVLSKLCTFVLHYFIATWQHCCKLCIWAIFFFSFFACTL